MIVEKEAFRIEKNETKKKQVLLKNQFNDENHRQENLNKGSTILMNYKIKR